MTSLIVPVDAHIPNSALDLEALMARAAWLAEGARAANTRKAYAYAWTHFGAWCARHHLIALPASPATVGLYLTAHAGVLSVATLTRRLSAIAVAN